MKKRIVTVSLVLSVLFCGSMFSQVVSFAADDAMPSADELIELAMSVYYYNSLINNAGYVTICDPYPGYVKGDFETWAEERGYAPKEKIKYQDLIKDANGDITKSWGGYPFPEGITSETMLQDALQVMSYDMFRLGSVDTAPNRTFGNNANKFLFMYDGRLYHNRGECMDLSLDFNVPEYIERLRIVSSSDDFIVMGAYSWLNGEEFLTVEYTKTENGWRVSGGTFVSCLWTYPPPQTGDRTPVYLTISLLSLAALTVTAVGVSKKRKKML